MIRYEYNSEIFFLTNNVIDDHVLSGINGIDSRDAVFNLLLDSVICYDNDIGISTWASSFFVD